MISSEIVKKIQQTMYAEQYMHHVYHEPIPTANQRIWFPSQAVHELPTSIYLLCYGAWTCL